jgi:acyl carrier protein
MSTANEDRIRTIVSRVFGVPLAEVTDDTSPDSIAGWDSLNHINLMLALEAEFGVSLSPDDTMEMLSVGLIRSVLTEYGVQDSDGRE